MSSNEQRSTCYRCGESLLESSGQCPNCASYQGNSIDFVSASEVENFSAQKKPSSPTLSLEDEPSPPITVEAAQGESEEEKIGSLTCPRCDHDTTLDDEYCDNCLYYINDLLEHDVHFHPPEEREANEPFNNYRNSTAQSNMENLVIVVGFLLLFLGTGFYLAPSQDVEVSSGELTRRAEAVTSQTEDLPEVVNPPQQDLSRVFRAIAAATQQHAQTTPTPEIDTFNWGKVDSDKEYALDALYEAGHISESDYHLLKDRMNQETHIEDQALLSEQESLEKLQSHAMWKCDSDGNTTPRFTSNPTRDDSTSCSPRDLSETTYNKYRHWHRGWRR